MRKLVIGAIVVLAFSSAAFAQPGGRGGFGRGGGGFGGFGRGGGSGPVALLQREDVQQELDITKDQLDEIQEVTQESRGGRGRGGGGGFGNFRDMSESERAKALADMRAQREKQTQETREKLNDILSKEQSKRLSQLEFQFALQQGAVDAAISAGGIEVSERDREKLRDVQREVGEATRAKIAKIQRDAQLEILKTLVSESEIEKLAGAEFTFAAQQRNFGRGGERGTRGSRRGRPESDSGSDDDAGRGERRGRRR